MRNLRAEYPAWFEPDEVQILLAAFDKAWEGCSSQQHQIPGGQTRICAGDTRETNYCGRNGRRARPGPAARRRSTRLGSIKSVSGPAIAQICRNPAEFWLWRLFEFELRRSRIA